MEIREEKDGEKVLHETESEIKEIIRVLGKLKGQIVRYTTQEKIV